jgi:hypothetical protein
MPLPVPLALAVTLSDDMAACQWLLPVAVATGSATVHASRLGLPGSGQCMPAGTGREVTVARARAASATGTHWQAEQSQWQPKSPCGEEWTSASLITRLSCRPVLSLA